MKTTSILMTLLSTMAATAIASPNALPMGVEVVERDGKTIVREVPHALLSRGLEPRCRECVGQGGSCTIGDGSCYAENPPLSLELEYRVARFAVVPEFHVTCTLDQSRGCTHFNAAS
ncbi:hypothetical protein FZEAL_10535 [Fusarium zealandicum]|uniref:Uncharacterized protein n=1 Tax=Fusarium zealandicum TaxID=1053134 RepID=A0A8H4U0A8_9HYPO|nr:hypothetical protein FZEAL_10535 [Fusarium zealandicum]